MKEIIIRLILIRLISVIVSLFGLFIAYQIVRKILGGSWSTENIIISLFVLNLSISFMIGLALYGLKSGHKHLSNQFRALANDFKGAFKKAQVRKFIYIKEF